MTNFTTEDRQNLITSLLTTYLYTEHSGNKAALYTFSNAGGASTYSFGLVQFDVGARSDVRVFLSTIGFTQSEIASLSGSAPIANLYQLNTKLQNNINAIDAFTIANISNQVDKLDALITEVNSTRPDVAQSIIGSQAIQIQLMDYDNQFNIGGVGSTTDGPFLQFLKGGVANLPGGQNVLAQNSGLMSQNIVDFIGDTQQALQTPTDISRRNNDLRLALNTLGISFLNGDNVTPVYSVDNQNVWIVGLGSDGSPLSINLIAAASGKTIIELEAANIGKDLNNLKLGDVINISTSNVGNIGTASGEVGMMNMFDLATGKFVGVNQVYSDSNYGLLTGLLSTTDFLSSSTDSESGVFSSSTSKNQFGTVAGIRQLAGSLSAGEKWGGQTYATAASSNLGTYLSNVNFVDPSAAFQSNVINSFNFNTNFGAYIPNPITYINVQFLGFGLPVVLDLNQNGVELISLDESRAMYDMQGTGFRQLTAWVAPSDGLLAFDYNHDGIINERKEINFVDWTNNPEYTDMEALAAAFDSNINGLLDSGDAQFANFKVWQDKNADGVNDAGELKSLAQLGISSINLKTTKMQWSSGVSSISGLGSYTKTDGTKELLADVALGHETQGWKASVVNGIQRVTSENGDVYAIATPSGALVADLTVQGFNGAIGGAGADNLSVSGSAAVFIQGNAGNDVIAGGSGDDWLEGGAGSDTISGGIGDDTIFVDSQDNLINIKGGAGFDIVAFNGNTTFTMNLNLSNGFEAAIGGDGNDNISAQTFYSAAVYRTKTSNLGNIFIEATLGYTNLPILQSYIISGGAGSDTIKGGVGNDILDGGAGNDTLYGDWGNDIYLFGRGSAKDIIKDELSKNWTWGADKILRDGIMPPMINGGIDAGSGTAYEWISDRSKNKENQPQITDYDNQTRNNDTLRMGQGILVSDVLLEKPIFIPTAPNYDLLIGLKQEITKSSVTELDDYVTIKNWSFGTNGKKVENIEFTDGTKLLLANWIQGTNGANDNLSGNVSDNVLNGLAGADTMTGGAGNDIYVVDNISDVVVETSNQGTDTIQTSVTYSSLGINLENLTLVGTSNIDGTGNALINIIKGNDGNNLLNGEAGDDTLIGGLGNDTLDGGLGSDILNGGDGDDTYVIDIATDVIQADSGGNDTVTVKYSTGTYTLATDLENITLFGSAAINGTGNALNNNIVGNDGNNLLNGNAGDDYLLGGAGNDTLDGGTGSDILTGGAGNDTYVFGNGYGYDKLVDSTSLIESSVLYLKGISTLDTNWVFERTLSDTGDQGMLTLRLKDNSGNTVDRLDFTNWWLAGNNNTNRTIYFEGDGYTATMAEIEGVLVNTTTNGNNLLYGSSYDDYMEGLAGNDKMYGNAGNDYLSGDAGSDTLDGGTGNDTYYSGRFLGIDLSGSNLDKDIIIDTDSTVGNVDTLSVEAHYYAYTDLTTYSTFDGYQTYSRNLSDGHDSLTIDFTGYGDGTGTETFESVTIQDYFKNSASKIENIKFRDSAAFNLATMVQTNRYTFTGSNSDDVMIGTAGLSRMIANAGDDYLLGTDEGNQGFEGNAGNDIIQGLGGSDGIDDIEGNSLLDAGAGIDVINSGYRLTSLSSSKAILIGGRDDDSVFSGDQSDVVLFNKGDGKDNLYTSAGAADTLSLGGNFAYSELSLTKTANDLILKLGATDQVTLKDWYLGTTHKNVVNLQVIAEAIQGFNLGSADNLRNNAIENFNFTNLVTAFDAAGTTANWQLTDARLTTHLQSGSDSAAIGGDLAYQYGKNSNLTGMGLMNAQSVISAASFGQTAQTLNNPSVWQAEVVKLG